MATSGNSNYTTTRDEIIKRALRLLGVIAQGQVPNADQYAEGSIALNSLVKAWQADGMPLWAIKQYAMTLVAGQKEYDIGVGLQVDTAKPLKVFQAWLHDSISAIDVPMRILTRQEYNILGNKDTVGMPIQIYYDPQRDQGVMHVFPTPDNFSEVNKTINFVYQRPYEDFDTATDSPDFPQEWYDAVTYGLATRLAPEYGLPNLERKTLWQEMSIIKQEALNFGLEEGSLYFGVERRNW
jgi:hypothetical protein